MRRDFIDSHAYDRTASADVVVVRLRVSYLLGRWQQAPISAMARGADP